MCRGNVRKIKFPLLLIFGCCYKRTGSLPKEPDSYRISFGIFLPQFLPTSTKALGHLRVQTQAHAISQSQVQGYRHDSQPFPSFPMQNFSFSPSGLRPLVERRIFRFYFVSFISAMETRGASTHAGICACGSSNRSGTNL